MARYRGPKDRLSRREGFDLFDKGGKLGRLNVPPGVHGPKGSRRSLSQYGSQLREKQKVKRFYGLLERQFKKYMAEALKQKGNTSDALFSLLESRLDNVVYRLGLAESRAQARQFVSHKHVYVDGRRVNIPSYQVKSGQTITLSSKILETPFLVKLLKDEEIKIPEWLERKAAVGKVKRKPQRSDVPEAFEDADIVEFYSR